MIIFTVNFDWQLPFLSVIDSNFQAKFSVRESNLLSDLYSLSIIAMNGIENANKVQVDGEKL